MSLEEASEENDYPPGIWRQATQRWEKLGKLEQEQRIEQHVDTVTALFGSFMRPSFGDTFSPFDILWFGLALVTAYKIGVGTYGSD